MIVRQREIGDLGVAAPLAARVGDPVQEEVAVDAGHAAEVRGVADRAADLPEQGAAALLRRM